MIHIRRSDYIQNNEQLSIEYYEKSINYAIRNIDNFKFDIFTDDVEWVNSQEIFSDAQNIYGPTNTSSYEEDVVRTFSKMLNYNNFIIANSTFSWWSARISYTEESTVIYPKPFFKKENFDIFPKEWVGSNHIDFRNE